MALRLGWRSVEEMEQEMSFREYQEWIIILRKLSPQMYSMPAHKSR